MKSIIFASLIVMAFHSCDVVGADFPCTDTYLIAGEMTSDAFQTSDRPRASSQFLIAITPERVLVGWSYENMSVTEPRPRTRLDIRPARRCHQVFRFAELNLPHSVSLECTATYGRDILQSSDRTLTALVRQDQLPDATSRELIVQSISGPFNDCPLCFFAQDPTRDLTQQQFCGWIETGEGAVSNEYCDLRLHSSSDNGHQLLTLSQREHNSLSVDTPVTLADAKTAFYPSGLQSIHIECDFDCALKDLGKAPWTARIVNESIGRNGKSIGSKREVRVSVIDTDRQAVDRAIDDVLKLAREGTHVVTDDKLYYEWKAGKIELSTDPNALLMAEGLAFDNHDASFYGRLIAICAITIASLGIYVFVSKKPISL